MSPKFERPIYQLVGFHPFFIDRLDLRRRFTSSPGCSKEVQFSIPSKAMTSPGDWREGPSAGFEALGALSIHGKVGVEASKLKNSRTKIRMVRVALMPLIAENLAASLSTNQMTLLFASSFLNCHRTATSAYNSIWHMSCPQARHSSFPGSISKHQDGTFLAP